MGQSRISSHLAQLKKVGLVADRRAGKNIFYGLPGDAENPALARLREVIQASAKEISRRYGCVFTR